MIENISDVYNAIQGRRIGFCGLIISVYDLAIFFETLFRGQLICQESLEEMKECSFPNKDFGLGMSIVDTDYGTAYGYIAKGSSAMTTVFHFPDTETTIVYCSNIGTHNETPNAMVYTAIWKDILDPVFERRNDPNTFYFDKSQSLRKDILNSKRKKKSVTIS